MANTTAIDCTTTDMRDKTNTEGFVLIVKLCEQHKLTVVGLDVSSFVPLNRRRVGEEIVTIRALVRPLTWEKFADAIKTDCQFDNQVAICLEEVKHTANSNRHTHRCESVCVQ